jgi:hypothetical protein
MSGYKNKLAYLSANGNTKAYPPNPIYHDVLNKPIKYHKVDSKTGSTAKCSKNIYLEISDEQKVDALLVSELCLRCFR